MTEKSELQKPFVEWLQKNGIDFIHLSNSGFGGKHRAYSTTAFEDTPAIKEKIPCDKYAPDFFVAWGGNVWLIEFGIAGQHTERKAKQLERMSYWRDCGGARTYLITSKEALNLLVDEMSKAERPAHWLN